MRIDGRRCPTCAHETPSRDVADGETCACGSRACLMSSAEKCITTNRARAGTVQRDVVAPPKHRMLTMPGVRK